MSKFNDINNKNEKTNNKKKNLDKDPSNSVDSLSNKNKIDENEENKEESISESEDLGLDNKEIEKLKDQLLRTLAENENLRKRTSKDIDQIKRFGHINFVRDLLSSVDNLTRAVNASPIEKEKLDEPIKNLIIGVEIVLKEINSFLEKNSIKRIDPIGEKFDYNVHQAMYEAPSDKYEPGTVIEVVQSGYLLYDRLVRPAMVGISKKIEKNSD
tara:strand:+ start:22 stop:660 length:639 start_codon:yes stop_codon:yes gene_type:complete